MALGSLGAVVYDVVAQDKTKEGLESASARAKNMNKTALMVGAGMTAVGVGAKLMADNINKTYLSFDSAIAEVKSLGGVTAEQMAIMRSSAIDISKELPLSARTAAKGFYMMRSAGFDVARVIEELPAIADMAVAGNLEMADAVNSVTMVLDTYGERAGTAADITNVLMGTVQGFKTTLPELQMQLSKSVGVAASLGIEFHELAAMSGMLKKEFVNAEEAGTGMKTMLLRLVDPKVQAQLEGMGVEVKDVNGDFIGMQSVLDSLGATLKTVGGDVEQMAVLQKLFGAEGIRAAMSLIRQKDSLGEFSAQVNAGVSVQEALNAVLESTQSQLTIAENKMDAARIQLGEGMAPATIFAAEAMSVFAGVLSELPGPLNTVVGSGIKLSESLIAIGPAIAGFVPLINLMRTTHIAGTIAAHAATAAQWLLNAAMTANPIGLVVVAIAGIIAILIALELKFGIVTKAVDGLGKAFSNIVEFFKGAFTAAIDGAKAVIGAFGDKLLLFLGPIGLVLYAFKNWDKIGPMIHGALSKVYDYITAPFMKAYDWLLSLPSQFMDAGKGLVNAIVDGIISLASAPYNAIKGALGPIGDLLPGSDAEEGALSGLTASGKATVTTFAKGIESEKGIVSGSFGDAIRSTPIAEASTGESGGSGEKNTYEGDSISIGDISLSRDYDFPALMKDIENYQSKKRVQRGIRTI